MNILRIWQHPDSMTARNVAGPRYLITALSLLNLLISCVYLITNLHLGIDPGANIVQILGSVVTLVCLRCARSHAAAAHVFLGMALVNACFLVFTFVDFPYTIVIWMPVFAIVSVYLAGMVAGGTWSFFAITMVSMVILAGRRLNPDPTPIAAADLPAITVITLYLAGLTAFVGSMFFGRSIRHLLQIQEKQNEELKKQNETIQAYAADKNMLVSVVTHDIATPLTIILHASATGLKHPSEAGTSLERIQRAASMIKEISLSVREYQAVESGRSTVRLEVVDLKEIFVRIRFSFEDRLREKSLTLDEIVPDGESLLVMAEADSLANSVLNNLICNAIKFSHPQQKIELRVQVGGHHIEVQIRDFGVGIPDDRLKTIFLKQGGTSSKGTMGERGSGYGLSIAKAYLDKFGADIRVESIEEKNSPDRHGTTVTLRLRRAAQENGIVPA
jgi:signal transduction histidine kinase